MKLTSRARHVTILLAAITLLGFAVFGPTVWQARQTRADLYEVIHRQGRSLVETLLGGITNAVQTNDEVVSLIEAGIRDAATELAAAATADLDNAMAHAQRMHDPAVIAIWRRDGSLEALWPHTATPPFPEPDPEVLRGWPPTERVYGFFEDPLPDPPTYGILTARPGGGAVYVGAHPDELAELRRRFGVGRLVKETTERAGARFVILQDLLGVVAAAGELDEVSAIDSDPGLRNVWDEKRFAARRRKLAAGTVLEFIAPYTIDGEVIALVRVGMPADPLERMQSRFRARFLISSALFLTGIATAAAILRGILAFRRREARFRAEEVRTESILESIADGVLVLDVDSRVLTANPASESLLGGGLADWIGRPATAIGELARAGDWLRGEAREPEIVLATSGGKHLRLVRTVLEQPDLQMRATVLVIRDETDAEMLRTLERRAEQWTTVSHMAGAVAHEIRNPLNAVSMFVQRLYRRARSTEDAGDVAGDYETARREIDRINAIVVRFLKVARPPRAALADGSLSDCLTQAAESFRRGLRGDDPALGTSIETDLRARFDAALLHEAVTNLLANARDAAGGGGLVRMSAGHDRESFWIRIEDSGAGVPAAERDRIFDLYYTTKAEGSGLGLPLAHHIARSHGGTLEVRSSELGGACFELSIPATDPDE
jgi:signal transduction histidine kinase